MAASDEQQGKEGEGGEGGEGGDEGEGEGVKVLRLSSQQERDELDSWHGALKEGDECDAQDKFDNWFEGVVMEGPNSKGYFKVHRK